MTGNSYRQEGSYHRLVRHERESERIRNYVEESSVRARLVRVRGMGDRWVTEGYPADRTISQMAVREFAAGRTDQRGGDNAAEWKAGPQTQARFSFLICRERPSPR
jgi:hypothetical protein